MNRIYVIFCFAMLSILLAYGCGSEGTREARSIMRKQADITEDYLNDLSNAENADGVVKAIDKYSEGMRELIPELREFNEKYPEYKEGKIPEGLEEEVDRLREASSKIPGAMMKMAKYMMNSSVNSLWVSVIISER